MNIYKNNIIIGTVLFKPNMEDNIKRKTLNILFDISVVDERRILAHAPFGSN